jgi:DMSO/TMAO reductase YedYZ molybdopterin-dependent catalytic subunit
LKTLQAPSNATSVFVQASDGYGTSIPIQDAMQQDTIIAYQKDDQLLSALKDAGEGPLRLNYWQRPDLRKRWVRGVAAIEVLDLCATIFFSAFFSTKSASAFALLRL